jgi:hypothetical protein
MDEFDYDYDDDDNVEPTKRKRSHALYRAGQDPQIIERWDRINDKIQLQEVIADLHDGESRELFSCPFHGRDSRPSFKVYPLKNNAWCFGCPDGAGYYDSVRFVAAKLSCSKLQAIVWLEKKYRLSPIEAEPEDDEDDDDDDGVRYVSLQFDDLKDAYIKTAAEEFLKNPNPYLARQYIGVFFDSVPERELDPTEQRRQLVKMAEILGQKELDKIKARIDWSNDERSK